MGWLAVDDGAVGPRRTDRIEPQVGPPFNVNAATRSPIRWAEQDFKNAWNGDPLLQPVVRPTLISALGKLHGIFGNCPGLARLAPPCGGTPGAILYNLLRIPRGDGRDVL